MIRIPPHPCPPELTPEVQTRLLAEYRADHSKAVWNKSYIRRELLSQSHGKCCYCECKVDEESKYLEVDHFLPKDKYEENVVVWKNLLSSCKRCNGKKSNHDTGRNPIIHPVNDNPKDHIRFRAYRFYEKTPLGKRTIEVVDLNDRSRLVEKRFEIGERIIKELNELEDIAKDFQIGINKSPRRERLITGKMNVLLSEALPDKEYAGTTATVLLNEPLFDSSKKILQECELWDDEMTRMETTARNIALDIF